MKKLFFLLGLALLALPLARTDVLAYTYTQPLQPGRTYEFFGLDPRVVSHIDVPGGALYEFVEFDSEGNITRFGFSSWRISVIGNGRVAITPVQSMRVTFDSRRLRIATSQGSVLTRTILQPGETASIVNTSFSDAHVRVTQSGVYSYDLITFDSFGDAVVYFTDARFPQFTVPGGGRADITAAGGSITVYFPSVLYTNALSVSTHTQPVMTTLALPAFFDVFLTNESNESINFTARTMQNNVDFRYRYVLRGSDGHVIRYGNAIGNDVLVPARSSKHITPVIDAKLVFPRVFSDFVMVGTVQGNPLYHALRPGQSVMIENNSIAHSHRIFATSGTYLELFSLNYVMYYDGDLSWGVLDNIVSEWAINLMPGAVLTVTVVDAYDYAALNIPIVNDIIITQNALPAKTRHHLLQGESAYVTNNSDYGVDVAFSTEAERQGLDYVLYDIRSGRVVSFGRVNPSTQNSLHVDSGQSAIITSADGAAWVMVPRELTEYGLEISSINRQALMRHYLSHGASLQIDNVGRLYNRSLVIEDETTGRAGRNNFEYEFTLTQISTSVNRIVFDYGIVSLGAQVVPPNSRLSITPAEGANLSVAFPTEWNNRYLRARTAEELPLHHIVLTPGSRININNRTGYDFEISNNSAPGSAGFHVRRAGDTGQIGRGEAPETGSIRLAAGQNITLIAALGEDLEIWMPISRARQLRLL